MKSAFVCLLLVATFALSQSTSPTDPKAQARIVDTYGKLPLSFEANRGQTDSSVKFLSHTGAYSLFLTGDEAVFTLNGQKAEKSRGSHPTGMLRMKLRNANVAAKVSGIDQLAGTSSYFIGNDPAKWDSNVPTYGKVKYEGIYSGIDLVYYGNQRQLEYDFIVAPAANPRRIAFDITGAKRIQRDAHGDLIFSMGGAEIRWQKPVVYQEKNGTRREVAADYFVSYNSRVSFRLANYDTSKELYIDPVVYATYLGGTAQDVGYGIAVDSAGDVYITGNTVSTNFPITAGDFQSTLNGVSNAFVAKINPEGTALVYSTYLGGSGSDAGKAIAVDSAGNAYVTGSTTSTDFPTMKPLQPTNGGTEDVFVTKLNSEGSALVYSTYLGGSGVDGGSAIAVDRTGDVFVTGSTQSANFPTMNALQPANGGGYDAFVAEIDAEGSALVYSTYLGGSGDDSGSAIAIDRARNTYVTGSTVSANFPTTPGVISGAIACAANDPGCGNAFVTKFGPKGSALGYSTYLSGGDGASVSGIAADGTGSTYVAGTLFRPTYDRSGNVKFYVAASAFAAKINPKGSAYVYINDPLVSKYGNGLGLAVDSSGSAYVMGTSNQYYGHVNFAYILKLNPTGSMLGNPTHIGIDFANTYANGIAADNNGNAYLTGYTDGTKFTTKNSLQGTYGGGSSDAFLFKIDVRLTTKTTLSSSPNPSAYGQTVVFTAVVSSSFGTPPDGEAVSFMKGTTLLGTGTLSGGSATFMTSTLKVGTDAIWAVYDGDSDFGSSKSAPLKQVVE